MKKFNVLFPKLPVLLGTILILSTACERELSDEVKFASFSNNADIFIDAPVGLGSDFYFPYGPEPGNPVGSKFTAWSVDDETSYLGTSSMRIDVPNANDPDGNYAGGILRIDGAGRDLSGFDALTFWAKASQGAIVGEIGFGEDFMENKYVTTLRNVSLSTQWTKYTIPIPDASNLTNIRGMLRYSAGSINNLGYTFWIDELRFEKLGTIAQARPAIQNGEDLVSQAFLGDQTLVTGLSQTFNLASGVNQTTSAAPSYFEFKSSDVDVARVNESGVVTILNTGTAKITAILGGVAAKGSLTLNVIGDFDFAPVPTRSSSDVISVFSDAYTNVPVDYYNGFFNGDGQTTQGGEPPVDINGDLIINYTDLNFVGIGTFLNVAPIDTSEMTHIHVDIKVNETVDSGDSIILRLLNSVGNSDETVGSITFNSSTFTQDEWVGLDIPLSDFTGITDRTQIGLLFFVSDNISDIYVDNIYYYR